MGGAWILNAYADSLTLLYVAAAIGGIGAGIVYGGSVGNALKWFPDKLDSPQGSPRQDSAQDLRSP